MTGWRKNVAGKADEMKPVQTEPGFLEDFPARGLFRHLADFDPAAGQLPLVTIRLPIALTEEDSILMGHDNRNSGRNSFR